MVAGLTVLVAKLGLMALGSLLSWLALAGRLPVPAIRAQLTAIFGFRWTVLVVAYGFFGFPLTGDVQGFEIHARWILEGRIPGRDFGSPYGLLFNAMIAAAVWLTGDGRGIVVAAQLVEFAASLLFIKAASARLGEERGRLASFVLLLNPLLISAFWFDGQDESLIFLSVAVVVALTLSPGNGRAVALTVGLSLLLLKPTACVFIAPALLYCSLAERIWAISIPAGGFLALHACGLSAANLRFEKADGTFDDFSQLRMPGNPWFLLEKFGVVDAPPAVSLGLTGLALTVIGLWLVHRARDRAAGPQDVTFPVVMTAGSFQFLAPYSTPAAFAAAAPAMALAAVEARSSKVASALFCGWWFLAGIDVPIMFRLPALRSRFPAVDTDLLFLIGDVVVVLVSAAGLLALGRTMLTREAHAAKVT